VYKAAMTPRRTLATVAFTALITTTLGATIGVAFANHNFPDVPTSGPFHAAVDNFVNAGCATGFPDNTYRPQDPVNRQQMARFVNSCGGRIAFDEVNSAGLATFPATSELASVQMDAGALGNGGGFIQVTASVEVSSSSSTATDFPCEAVFTLTQTGGNSGGDESVELDLDHTTDPVEDDSGALVDVIPVDAGDSVTVTVSGYEDELPACATGLVGETVLTATYFPFQGNGDGGAEPASVEPESTPEPEQ
jgi:hypothetical protein